MIRATIRRWNSALFPLDPFKPGRSIRESFGVVGCKVAEVESFRQPTTPGTAEEKIFFSFGEEADLFASSEDVERFRGKSSLSWLESAATVAGCRVG